MLDFDWMRMTFAGRKVVDVLSELFVSRQVAGEQCIRIDRIASGVVGKATLVLVDFTRLADAVCGELLSVLFHLNEDVIPIAAILLVDFKHGGAALGFDPEG